MPDALQTRDLGERVFSDDDQRHFARLSGDHNPMHLDPIAARRVLTGRQVVHGVHLLLWSLERWQAGNDARTVSVACSFDNAVSIGERVSLTERLDTRGRIVITASVDNVVCVRTVITTSPARKPASPQLARSNAIAVDAVTIPLNEAPESHVGKVYSVTPADRGLCAVFPGTCATLGPERVAALAALSFVAGMVAPGLHSVLSSIKFDVASQAQEHGDLFVSIEKYHANVRLFDIAFDGALNGTMQAFYRPAPRGQQSVGELSGVVRGDEFQGTRSLIIGGSRGLGELTAKLLAAGGGQVALTYRDGREDAQRVSDEITRERAGAVSEVFQLDVATAGWDALDFARRQFDAVYFFPTPRIFRKGAAVFSEERFEQFFEIYVKVFFAMCEAIERSAVKPVRVFLPSSIAVVERPKGMTEYAMAKAAAEVLAADINRSFTTVSVIANRLPRLNTDQTASILDVPSESNVDTLLPIVRSMCGVA